MTELLSEKHLLTLSLNGGCGRRGSLRRECREHWPGSPNTGLQKPGRPPASHMTLSPSCAHLPSRSLFTSWNCGTTKSHNSSKYSKVKVKSCPTLYDPEDCSPPGSSVHGILQARILEWVAISFSRGSS